MKWTISVLVVILYKGASAGIEVATTIPDNVKDILNQSRRIINGEVVVDGYQYMVYLKLPTIGLKNTYQNWLCGGVILHEEYILTSAACIQDARNFYVVSGTYRYSDEDDLYSNPCIKNGAKRAIWKCVPKNYVFDGHENDNLRWMNNDIAIVKVEEGFDFARRIRGCDFIPKPISYNNFSKSYENAGNLGIIAGWGTTSKYSDWVNRRNANQQNLLTTTVELISKRRCKHRWGWRYQNIIENYMICSKDIGQTMSEICNDKYVNCQDMDYSYEDEGRRSVRVPTNLVMHSALHNETEVQRRALMYPNVDGGFCENDHGGPLIYGTGANAVVIGVISACLVHERTNKCYGPFLYTSVFKNREFINCAIHKHSDLKCQRQFRNGETHDETVLSWQDDGPAKSGNPSEDASQKPDAEAESKKPRLGGIVVPRAVDDAVLARMNASNAPAPAPSPSPKP